MLQKANNLVKDSWRHGRGTKSQLFIGLCAKNQVLPKLTV